MVVYFRQAKGRGKQNMDKRTAHIHLKTTPGIKKAATELAAKEGRTLSNFIESLLVEQIQKKKKKKREPL